MESKGRYTVVTHPDLDVVRVDKGLHKQDVI